jgi:hypothetical protein
VVVVVPLHLQETNVELGIKKRGLGF